MNRTTIENLSRRRFLHASLGAATGLNLGLCLPARAGAQPSAMATARAGGGAAEAAFAPNAFVRIAPDDVVTVVCKHLEMGQGTYTGLSTLVAEELDARWEQIRPIGAPADVERYNNLLWGQAQGTGGSTAIANAFEQMRRAGAAARAMLVAAAAERWGVPANEIEVADGVLRHATSGRRASLGAMAEAAAEQPVPDQPELKDPSRFRLIGKARLPRLDGPDKVAGRALFTQDVRLPNMLTALVAHPPRFGARAAGIDDRAALDVDGVVAVVRVPSGAAVLARDFWSAQRGRDALRIDWDERGAFRGSSEQLLADSRARAGEPGLPARSDGDAVAALAGAETLIEAEFTFPYLAHAAMEPLDCVIERTPNGGVRVINGEQFQTVDQAAIAEVLGLPPEKVALQMLYAGGSFGRRANPASDYLVEAAQIFKAHGGSTPIKLIWTREDDMRAGWYRPLYLHRLRAGLDGDGRPVGWEHRIVGQSIMAGTPMEGRMIEDGVDRTSVEGAADLPYAIPNLAVELHTTEVPVPVQWWRSVGSTHTGFATECMIDELATAAGADPVAFRLRLLEDHPRHRGVLELAAEKAGWGEPMADGRGRGVAVHESFDTYVAQVVEVTLTGEAGFTVDRVVIAVDCGVAVNPDMIAAQMEGGMGFGLSAALVSEITLEDGRVQQSNFDRYQVLRLEQMPEVEVHIVPSAEPPTGVGEPATPVIAPAVANALAAASGQRLRALPLRRAA